MKFKIADIENFRLKRTVGRHPSIIMRLIMLGAAASCAAPAFAAGEGGVAVACGLTSCSASVISPPVVGAECRLNDGSNKESTWSAPNWEWTLTAINTATQAATNIDVGFNGNESTVTLPDLLSLPAGTYNIQAYCQVKYYANCGNEEDPNVEERDGIGVINRTQKNYHWDPDRAIGRAGSTSPKPYSKTLISKGESFRISLGFSDKELRTPIGGGAAEEVFGTGPYLFKYEIIRGDAIFTDAAATEGGKKLAFTSDKSTTSAMLKIGTQWDEPAAPANQTAPFDGGILVRASVTDIAGPVPEGDTGSTKDIPEEGAVENMWVEWYFFGRGGKVPRSEEHVYSEIVTPASKPDEQSGEYTLGGVVSRSGALQVDSVHRAFPWTNPATEDNPVIDPYPAEGFMEGQLVTEIIEPAKSESTDDSILRPALRPTGLAQIFAKTFESNNSSWSLKNVGGVPDAWTDNFVGGYKTELPSIFESVPLRNGIAVLVQQHYEAAGYHLGYEYTFRETYSSKDNTKTFQRTAVKGIPPKPPTTP